MVADSESHQFYRFEEQQHISIYINQLKSIALPNKYTKIYIEICSRAISRGASRKEAKKIFGYVEYHHIIPKSFGLVDSKIKENQVFLTAKEHFICHHLLVKMFANEYCNKMWFALMAICMIGNHQRIKISARQYEFIKIKTFSDENFKKAASERATEKFTGTNYYTNNEITIRSTTCPDGFHLGRIVNRIEKNWFTNEVENKIALNCPTGYWPGRTNKSTKGMKWFTNGNDNICGFECPDGWRLWQTKIDKRKGLKYWTNGIENIYSLECPKDGFYLGHANKPRQEKFLHKLKEK